MVNSFRCYKDRVERGSGGNLLFLWTNSAQYLNTLELKDYFSPTSFVFPLRFKVQGKLSNSRPLTVAVVVRLLYQEVCLSCIITQSLHCEHFYEVLNVSIFALESNYCETIRDYSFINQIQSSLVTTGTLFSSW